MNIVFQAALLPICIVFLGFIAMSPVLALVGWRGMHSLLVVVSVCLLFVVHNALPIRRWLLFLILSILLSSMITAIYWGDLRYLFANVFLMGSFFIIQLTSARALERIVDLASILIFLVLIGAVVGFVYAFLGGAPLFEFPNPDTRTNYFFLSTLSNSVLGNIIRPAGIYDEPGALSLYVCAIAAIRHISGKSNFFTWALLLLGFVTLSLAHLIYVIFHILAERMKAKNICALAGIFLGAFLVAMSTGFDEVINDRLLQRLAMSETTGGLVGDNRSFRMFNAAELIREDPRIIFFGIQPICRFDYEECKALFPPIGENPLTPVFINGIFITWPFYLALTIFLLSPVFGRRYFVSFGFGILLLQRPEMLAMSGAMISSLNLYLLFRYLKRS